MTTLTPLPAAPQTSDPSTFNARADALLAALPVMVSEINAAGALTAGNATSLLGYAFNTEQSLLSYLLPSWDDKWRGIYRAGFGWWSENQRWGGPFGFKNLLDGATGTLYSGEAATGYIDASSTSAAFFGDANATMYRFQGFKVAESCTCAYVDVKLSKDANPTDNVTLAIYSDTAATPNALITNGTATAISGKVITSDSNGEIYRFAFATPPSLVGGTQYNIVIGRSGAADATNFYRVRVNAAGLYPFGASGYGSNVPAWTAAAAADIFFLVELSASAQIMQASGYFDGKLCFGDSATDGTKTMARGLVSRVPLHELISIKGSTIRLVGTAFTKDKTILDIGYGQDHDRLVVRCDATTGYISFSTYESDGTLRTVTGNIDASSGNHDIMIAWRAQNDGADFQKLYHNGVSQGTPVSAASIAFDDALGALGCVYVGGGFTLAPADTQKLAMGVLPSADSPTWTYDGTATESAAFSSSGGKMNQIKNGFTSTQYGSYTKSSLSLSNANGWQARMKFRVPSNTNTSNEQGCVLDIYDGTKRHLSIFQEYFHITWDGAYVVGNQQYDLKGVENAFDIQGKGSDYLEFVNHRLKRDGSGLMTSATASNKITFGDVSVTAGENADVVYDYMAYYNTAWNPPQFTGGSISEFACWQGDKTAFALSLYNSGTMYSVKQYMGVKQNYIDKSAKGLPVVQKGITGAPTTTSTALPPTSVIPEMESFVVGEIINAGMTSGAFYSSGQVNSYFNVQVDGVADQPNLTNTTPPAASTYMSPMPSRSDKTYLGLHKVSAQWGTASGTLTAENRERSMKIEARP